MLKRIAVAVMLFLAVAVSPAFAGKTTFTEGNPATGVKGTKVTAAFLNQTSHNVPTGEDLDGSAPALYGIDLGTANTYIVNLSQGKQRVVSTNTGTAANKLIDSLATFQTATVTIGDVVLNLTDETSATVTAIDSQTQLSLNANIFTSPTKSYAVGPNIQQLPQTLTAGTTISFKAANANTGASTINVNSLGAKAIKKNGTEALVAGDLRTGTVITVVYDGTNFQMVATPNADTVDGKNPGSASGIATLDANTRVVEAANKISDGTNAIHIKIIDIGDWDMDATATKAVAHGLDRSKIRSIVVMARNDAEQLYPLPELIVGTVGNGLSYVDSVLINLRREDTGFFDSVNFDSTSYNRGWITIIYVD